MKHPRTSLALFTAAAAVQFVLPAMAQAQNITPAGYSGGTYTQNFDTLPVRSPAPTNAPTGSLTGSVVFTSNSGPIALTDPLLYSTGVTPSTALTGWGFSRIVGTSGNTLFTWGSGTANSGSVYNFGSNDSSDRALGSLASGGLTPRFGALLINNTSTTYTGFSLSYFAEQWRSSTTIQNSLAFGYQIGSATDTNALFTSSSQTAVTSLNANALAPVASNGATVGNTDGFRTSTSGVVPGGSFSWGPGQILALTWSDTDNTGADAGIGVDDLSFTAIVGASYTPKNLTWTGDVNRIWDTTSANWTGGASTYTEDTSSGPIIADNVTFSTTGAGIVNIRPQGVQPNSVLVDSSADYSFAGGPVTGTTSLVKTGSGKLTLTAANTFSGGVRLNGGTLEITNDNQLGASGAALTVTEGATVRLNGPIVAARTLAVPTGGATFNTLGNNVVFGGLSIGTVGENFPTVEKTGAGDLSVGSVFTAFGSTLRISQGSLTIRSAGGGTNSVGAAGDDAYQGNLILDGHQQLDLAGSEQTTRKIAGGGQIIVKGPGRATPTTSYTGANTTTINARIGSIRIENAVVVNPDNNPNFRINFGASDSSSGPRTLTIAAPVTGNTEVNFRDPSFTSDGTVVIETPLAHTGRTTITMSRNGVVRLNTDNAIPATSALVFGDGFFNNATIGALDLNGRNLTVASLASERRVSGTNGLQPALIGGIVNTGGNAATVTIAGNATTSYDGGIGDFTSSNVATASTNIALTLAGTHTGQLTLTGAAGSVNYTGNTTVNGGKLTFATSYRPVTSTIAVSGTGEVAVAVAATAPGTNPVGLEVASIQLTGSSKLTVAPAARAGGVNSQATVITSALSIATDSFVDLGNNDLIVRGGSVANLRAAVRTWFVAADGLPGTVGLGSSTAFYTPDGAFTTLAVYDNSAGTIGTFNGISVSGSDVLVKYTYLGDTDIDGDVDASDLARVLQGLNGGGSGWNFGDVNYDGVVNFVDLGRVQAALRGQGSPLGTGGLGTGGGVIPEPSALGLLALAVPVLGRRRRV